MSEVFVRHFFMNNRKAEMIQKQIQEMLDHQSIIRTSDVVKNGQGGFISPIGLSR